MYLKKIEIAGFKSFADRTIIQFDQGLTAVVGPNGSGKSNITEAVRWVLGESSAKNLRGGKMPDIIFAGSEGRKPLNVAEVTVVLDNSERFLPLDFSEVSVTRRLNRKGESDFYINKQACRLKDIVELFMDSGLGKESFSIISQGKVEAIFNSKPEERRGIFEEAAGVLKYKQKKQQAQQKLFETEDNLNRLQDIIYELENQIEPLREQKQTAQQYLGLKERLTFLDVGVTVASIQSQKVIWQEKTAEVAALTAALSLLAEKQQTLETELSQLRQKRTQLLKRLDGQQQALLSVTQQFEQAEGQKKVLAERQKHSASSTEKYQTESNDAKVRSQQLHDEIAALTKEEASLELEEAQAQGELRDILQKLARYEKSSKEILAELRAEYVDVMQAQANTSNDLKHLEKQQQQELAKNQQSLLRYEKLQEKAQKLTAELERVTTAWQKKQQEVTGMQQAYEKGLQQEKKNKQELQMKERKMYDAMGILQQVKARRNSLEELKESHAGFYQGVRAVLQAQDQLPGIVGAVAELMQVPPQFAVAIETALGAAAQNIVVKDEASGRSGIQFLKEKRLGRGTFLPLTVIKARTLPADVLARVQQQPGFLGVASQLVTYDTSVSNIMANLLGTTLIAENLQVANQLAKAVYYKYRVVSLEGDIMNPGGSMTGGATKKGQSGSLFMQAHELEQLTTQLTSLETTLKTLEEHVRDLKKSGESVSQQLLELREKGEQTRFEEQDLQNQKLALEKERGQVTEEQQIFAFESEEMHQFLATYQEEQTALFAKQKTLQLRRTALDQEIQEADASESQRAAEKEALQQLANEKKGQLAVLEERANHLAVRLTERRQQAAENQQLLENLEQFIAQLSGAATDQAETVESLTARLQTLAAEKTQLERTIAMSKTEREALQTEISAADAACVQLNQQQQAKLQEKNKSDVALSRAEVTLDNALDYLQSEYHVTFEAAQKDYPLALEISAATAEVHELKQQIKALGAVNIAAIEQYAEVSQRYEFLVTQRDDLLTAKNSLFTTMNELDEEVILRFGEVFQAIRNEFQQVFPNMFGGGKADLILTTPDDLLNTGIEIVAQPPGKKLQSLSLLSGGERALTAIALLFSIIQVRPVPFCILDEVEAALDEANVARFGRYLAHFEKETQFIVVTHRKGTMEAADVLYGVTMQESGVSQIVSVRLEQVDERGEITAASS